LRNKYDEDEEVPLMEIIYAAYQIYYKALKKSQNCNTADNILLYMEKLLKLKMRLEGNISAEIFKIRLGIASIKIEKGQKKEVLEHLKQMELILEHLPHAAKDLSEVE